MSKLKLGRFKPITSDYWFTTFAELNPFVADVPYCPICQEKAVKERRAYKHGGAVSVNEFQCANKHRWTYEKVHD